MTYIYSGLILIHHLYSGNLPFLFWVLNLLELATHLEWQAAILRQEGLGHIKIVLAGTDTSSLLDILQAHFGHVCLVDSSEEEEDVPIEEEEGAAEETKAEKTKVIGNLASAELVLPFTSIPLVIAGIPQDLLPLCGP